MNLKKYIEAFVLSAAVLLSCGCGRQEAAVAGANADVFVYDSCENAHLIAAEDDTLYVLSDDDGNARLSVFDAEGNQTASTIIDGLRTYSVQCICANEDKLYAAVSKPKNTLICSVDINSGMSGGTMDTVDTISTTDTVCELKKLDGMEKLAVQDGKLYWLGQRRSEAKTIYPFTDKEGNYISYSDPGKKMGCVDLESGENIDSEIEFPVIFSASEGKVCVYAFDKNVGYYFTDYAEPSEKQYTNKVGSINNFEFYGKGGEIAFVKRTDGILSVSRADSESGVIKAVKGVYPYFASDLCASESGFVWIKNSDSSVPVEERIKRYDMNDFSVTGNPVRIITCEYYDEIPFSAGSEVQLNKLSDEGFALTVLSLDKSYDAALINSQQVFSNEIKEKGSFYPLNDVKGVSEYLDRCFPYIKEAVTDSEGNICMLPIKSDIPLMLYNEKNCAENGITFSTDLETFVQSVKKASSVSDYYSCTRYWMMQTQLTGYLSSGKPFDTEEFRRLAVILKEQCTEDVFRSNLELFSALITMQSLEDDIYYSYIYDNILFTDLLYHSDEIKMINDENLRAAPMPVPESGKNIAVCTFICVNPYSDRLSETVAYIENMVCTMSAERNSGMISDKSTYEDSVLAQELYSVYENGEIYFQIPVEIYAEDFDRYCNDEITLDEFIEEADRKLLTYLNE